MDSGMSSSCKMVSCGSGSATGFAATGGSGPEPPPRKSLMEVLDEHSEEEEEIDEVQALLR